MIVLARKTKKPVGLCRCTVELMAAVIGWLLGGMVGVGTVISFVVIGACIQIVFNAFKFDATVIRHETLLETLSRLARKKDCP
jgi:uncharacterized membrane protein YczE